MKLLVQSDDYGITKAASLGIIEGIKNGIIRNTGFFANMPWAQEVAEWIKPYLDEIALGIDINFSTGPALLSKEEIPTLVQDNGMFLTSGMNRALDNDENNHDHVKYEEVYKEGKAQVERFIKIFGRKPVYLHPHAYMTKTIIQVERDLAKEYDIPFSEATWQHYGANGSMSWYIFPPTLDNQAKSSLKDFILEDKGDLLGKEVAVICCHAGYVDKELMNLSSFNIFRLNDLAGVTAPEVKQWIKDNNIELITYRDLETIN